MPVRTGPCPPSWPLVGCGTSGAITCTEYTTLDAVAKTAIEEAAINFLWNWSGRRYGTCPITVRPCRKSCWQGSTYRGPGWAQMQLPWYGSWGGGPVNPALIGGEWFNLPCGGSCGDSCSCGPVEEVDLGGMVSEVTEVLLDGIVLAPSAYRVDNNRWLVRTDGGVWPECQDMDADTVPGSNTFAVSFEVGIPVPAGGQLAAGTLVCEMAKALCSSSNCQLPARTQRVSRQGVDVLVGSVDNLWSRGETGLILVDQWLASVNASKRGGGRVMSPDYRGTRRTTS